MLRKLQPKGLMEGQSEGFTFASERARERINQGSTDRVDFSEYCTSYLVALRDRLSAQL
jgi:hypothetical protein